MSKWKCKVQVGERWMRGRRQLQKWQLSDPGGSLLTADGLTGRGRDLEKLAAVGLG